MDSQTKTEKVNYNSIYVPKKPPMVKRFAALVIDVIMVIVLASGIAFLVSKIYNYDKYYNAVYQAQIDYGVYVPSDEGNITYDGKTYIICTEDKSLTEEEANSRIKALTSDKTFKDNYYKMNLGPIVITSIGLASSLLVFEFILPLCLKHGRTLGKFLFGIGYVNEDDLDVSLKNVTIKFLFGKLIVNAVIPYTGVLLIIYQTGLVLIGLAFVLGVPIINLLMLFLTKDKRLLSDYIGKMKPVDNNCQVYFKNIEDLNAAKCKDAVKEEKTKKIVY